MDFSTPALETEWRRQIYLCNGIGFARMMKILQEQSFDCRKYVCHQCGKKCDFSNGTGHDHTLHTGGTK